jgi:hypothetical protein
MQKASNLFGEFCQSKLMPPLPNQRYELFAQNLARGMSIGEAYVAAGYRPHPANPSRLRAKERIRERVAELQIESHEQIQKVIVKQASITRQHLVDALLENLDISLGRRPVKQGPAAIPVEQYLYRGEVANNAIKMAGSECGLFREKTEVTHRMDFSDLSDEELLIKLRDETEALLLERRAAGLDGAGDDPEPST